MAQRFKDTPVLGKPGDDLLSRVLRRSTIGAEEFNGRVRDGIGYRLLAVTTRPAKDGRQWSEVSNQDDFPPTVKQADHFIIHSVPDA